MRERLIGAATELFYANGIRAVSVDKVIEGAGTTKVTFYRHFKAKDDLVVAYLEHLASGERAGVQGAVAAGGGDVHEVLRLMAEFTGGAACTPGFRGCPFINAAAEYPDVDSPVRRAVAAHRDWYLATFRDLLAPLVPDPAATAEDLMLLRDGVMVAGYLGDPTHIAASFRRSCEAVLRSEQRQPA